jgi:hypothetical protein
MAAKQRDPARERFWRDVKADWQSSGLSIRAYCLQHRLAETAFHYWRRELRQRDAKPAARCGDSADAGKWCGRSRGSTVTGELSLAMRKPFIDLKDSQISPAPSSH